MYTSKLNAGDLLSRPKGLVTHYGIAVASTEVLEIVPQSIPRIVTLERFANGRRVQVRQSHTSDRPAIVSRARQVASSGKLYNFATYNCEHVKNYVLTGTAYSESVRLMIGLLFAVGAIAVVARSAR